MLDLCTVVAAEEAEEQVTVAAAADGGVHTPLASIAVIAAISIAVSVWFQSDAGGTS